MAPQHHQGTTSIFRDPLLTEISIVHRPNSHFISSIPLPNIQRLARPAKRDARKEQSRSHQPSEWDTQRHPRTWHFDAGRLLHRDFWIERPHCSKDYKPYPRHRPSCLLHQNHKGYHYELEQAEFLALIFFTTIITL